MTHIKIPIKKKLNNQTIQIIVPHLLVLSPFFNLWLKIKKRLLILLKYKKINKVYKVNTL